MHRLSAALGVAATMSISGCDLPEVASSLVVIESDITTHIVGDDLVVEMPVETVRGTGERDSTLQGSIGVSLFDASSNTYLGWSSLDLEFAPSSVREIGHVRFRTVRSPLDRIDTATLVLVWQAPREFAWETGRRSVYATLAPPRFEVLVRAPRTLAPGGSATVRVIARGPEGTPVPNAEVSGRYAAGGAEIASFTGETDDRGELVATVAVGDSLGEGTLRVEVTHDAEAIATEHPMAVRELSRVYLSSDKTIYQPGQDIHLRALVLEGGDRRPRTLAGAFFIAKDARGNAVFRRAVTTDEFGVAAATVPTDTRVLEGVWTFAFELDGESTAMELPVRRYELPRLRVDVRTERPFVLAGEPIRGSIHAAYRFGEPVAGGAVVLEARSETGAVVAQLTGTTDAGGAWSFELPIAGSDRATDVRLSALVTDSAAQTETGETALVIAPAALAIDLVPPERASDGTRTAFFVVSDPLGRPVRATVDVSGIAAESDASGIAEVALPAEWRTLDVTATDGAGRAVSRRFELDATARSPVFVAPDRPSYAGGETARFRVRADRTVERVFVDVYAGAIPVLSTELAPSAGGTVVAVPIQREWSGVLVFDAFGITSVGDTVSHTARVLVERDDRLQVALASSAETYRPGQDARIDVSVTDRAGAPQVAVVGMTVVDESVFTLGGEPRTTLEDAFGLDASAFPPNTIAPGLGPRDVSALPAGDERDRLLRVLLRSGSGDPGATLTASEAASVRAALTAIAHTAATQTLTRLATEDIGAIAIEDPFGTPYRLRIVRDPRGAALELLSAGPDEAFGGSDDVSVTVPLVEGGAR
jgi:hypothetical protein